jgi:hypothetical protein
MATNITFTLDDTSSSGQLGPQRGPSGRVRETVKATGDSSSAGDDGTYVPTYCHKNCTIIDGDFFIDSETDTIAGASLSIKAISALNSNTVRFTLEGDF